MYEMDDAIASHIVAITKKVFALTEQDTFYQLGQMSKFIKEKPELWLEDIAEDD